jgi:hypothetical protein
VGALAGAAGFGLAGWVFTLNRREGASGGDVAIIAGAAALGAGVGFAIFPGSRVTQQIYPVLRPRPRFTAR